MPRLLNPRSTFHPLAIGLHHLVVVVGVLVALPAAADGERLARYSTVQPGPSLPQWDPLAARITTTLAASITQVGEAIEHLLAPSGYRLVRPGEPAVRILMDLPLPAVHRRLGPMPLRQALAVLAGPAFTVREDPIRRQIAIVPIPLYAPLLEETWTSSPPAP